MKLNKPMASGFLLVLSIGFCCSPAFPADNPQSTIKNATAEVLQILRENQGRPEGLREQLRNVADRYFDFNEISKRALGPRWNGLSPQKQQEFTHDFSKLLFNTYVGILQNYRNAQISYSRQSQTQDNYAVVEAVVTRQSQRALISYYLIQDKNGDWRVFDVVAEGVGLVANYRSQFDAILSRSSFDDLLMKLRQKISQG